MAPKLRGRSAKNVAVKMAEDLQEKTPSEKKEKNKSSDEILCGFCFVSYSPKYISLHEKKCLMTPKEWTTSISKEISCLSSTKAKFFCQYCNKKFMHKKSYIEHVNQEHSKLSNSMSCKECSAKCPNESALKSHMSKAHAPPLHKCKFCSATFTRNYHVIRHMKQKGCGGEKPTAFNCKICDTSFTRKDNLMYHLRKSHISIMKKYKCKHCLFGSDNYNKLILHYMARHMEKGYRCHHCDKIVHSRVAICKHMEIHGEKKFECTFCDYKTFTIEVMKRHMLSHSKEKPFKCPKCPSSFIQMQQLRNHMSTRHEKYICDFCGKDFKTRYRLTTHSRTHLGLPALKCPFDKCAFGKKEFANEATLDNHVKAHALKLYICELCNKAFHNEMNLKRHMKTHTLDRPRRCMYCVCARAYVRSDRFILHVRLQHETVFMEHLHHVRNIRNMPMDNSKVTKDELNSILAIMDELQDRVLQENGNGEVLYGGICNTDPEVKVDNPLMTEEELTMSLSQLLVQLIDTDTLKEFGWPLASVDVILEKVIEQCGQKAADRERWSRVQCLRENTKHLFLYVIEHKDIKKMLEVQTIDQVVRHILNVNK